MQNIDSAFWGGYILLRKELPIFRIGNLLVKHCAGTKKFGKTL